MRGTWQTTGGGGGGGGLALAVIAAAVLIGSGAVSAAVSALVTILIITGSVIALAVLGVIAWLVHRARRRRPVYALAADRQARYACYCYTARRGTFGPAADLGLCTLTDTLEVLGLPVDELERRALARLAAGDPLIVAVVDDLLNRAARNDYDPARYAVPGLPARHLRAIPPTAPGNPTRKDSETR